MSHKTMQLLGVGMCLAILVPVSGQAEEINITTNVTVSWDDVTGDRLLCVPEANCSDLQGNSGLESTDHLENVLKVRFGVLKYFLPVADTAGFICCALTILMLRKGTFKSSAAVYITGISAANLLRTLLSIAQIVNSHLGQTVSRDWKTFYIFFVCYLYWLQFVLMSANVWTITAFATERLIAIFWPMKARLIVSESRAKKIVIAIFVVAILVNIPRIFRRAMRTEIDPLTNQTVPGYYFTELGRNMDVTEGLNLFFTLSTLTVPFPVLALMSVGIIYKLRLATVRRENLKCGVDAEERSRQTQIERVLIASVLTYLFCNLAIASITVSVALHGHQILQAPILELQIRRVLSTITTSVNSILNFLVYVCCSKNLRDAMIELLFCGQKPCHKLAARPESA